MVCGRASLILLPVLFNSLPVTFVAYGMSGLSTFTVSLAFSCENLVEIIDLCPVLIKVSALEAHKWLFQRTIDAKMQFKQTPSNKTNYLLQAAQKKLESTCHHPERRL